ncbi:hypothetical protein KK137_06440 [Croceibacterium sp. LX-88]|uniref:EF-hand domain-containing protein n=1 Tax=Croceibacterium selenioxidans TaxID=2838833 RepID=A0ABS5W2J0_9SPHN|nr:hypothetical protein [Croceibacterium selenioxidans]MBT2133968.1 hypothetical protein [Croceibacterium selenioxidans]
MNMMTAIHSTTALTGLGGIHSPLNKDDWGGLMASYLAAKKAEDGYDVEVWTPAYEREKKFVKVWGGDRRQLFEEHPEEFVPSEVDDEMERLQDVRCDLEDALVAMPAPDGEALLWKLDHLLADRNGDGCVSAWSLEFVAQTVADCRRILGDDQYGLSVMAAKQTREPDLVGPDLGSAEPIEKVIKSLAALRNNYPTAFIKACKDSGIDVTVMREADGVDHLMLGCPCDGQEKLRLHRLDALRAQLRRGKSRRQDVIDTLNLCGRFADNQPFGSIEEAAEAYLGFGGRIYVLPDGQCEETTPYDEERIEAEHYDGYPMRRMLQRYQLTLGRRGAREAMAAYVRQHGALDEKSKAHVLEREGQANG